MHDFSRFSCLWNGDKTLIFSGGKSYWYHIFTPAFLPAGVKVTFILTFTRTNVIYREQKFTHKLAYAQWCLCVLRNDAWVSMDIYGFLWVSGYLWVSWVSMSIYSCIWVFIGTYRCLWVSVCLWVSIGVYGFLGVYGYWWVFMGVYKYYI